MLVGDMVREKSVYVITYVHAHILQIHSLKITTVKLWQGWI
jgi:hypothetical protein